MAFKFRSKSSLQISAPTHASTNEFGPIGSKQMSQKSLNNTQLNSNNSSKIYPSWLKSNTASKQLPGLYQGVLGQVQLQPGISIGSQLANRQKLVNRQQQVDYMNRFTDTERVHQLLSTSHLSNENLATIWTHVNKTFPGKLTNREVCLALALIAIFQQQAKKGGDAGDSKPDPFSLVRAEKKPPVPTLYSGHSNQSGFSSSFEQTATLVSPTKTNTTTSSGLLVDICDDEDDSPTSLSYSCEFDASSLRKKTQLSNGGKPYDESQRTKRVLNMKSNINLIDIDSDAFGFDFSKLIQTWLKFLNAMKTIFKRSFDILNVENSRQSAIEALRSPRGKQFSAQLCLCYPLAHNLRLKIDELQNISLSSEYNDDEQIGLFDKNYIVKIDDLMTSINEYWAVLINLFHESGQTKLIELIMDGLNYKKSAKTSKSFGELANELGGLGKSDVCSICHTKFYLTTCNDTPLIDQGMSLDVSELVRDSKLISVDGQYYYHTRCANFWLNQVDSSGLPFHAQEFRILSPDTKVLD